MSVEFRFTTYSGTFLEMNRIPIWVIPVSDSGSGILPEL